jgi:ubiquinone/menaquinone biosynthesis C-methylase UbiE
VNDGYYDGLAEGYNQLHAAEQLAKYRIIAHELHLPANARVLDVGAGTGIGNQIIPNIGIDPSPALIAQHPNTESLVGRAEALPFPDNSFDAVISVTALHHTDYKQALREMQRVSKGPVAVSLLKKSSVTEHIVSYMQQHMHPFARIEEEKDIILISNPRKA